MATFNNRTAISGQGVIPFKKAYYEVVLALLDLPSNHSPSEMALYDRFIRYLNDEIIAVNPGLPRIPLFGATSVETQMLIRRQFETAMRNLEPMALPPSKKRQLAAVSADTNEPSTAIKKMRLLRAMGEVWEWMNEYGRNNDATGWRDMIEKLEVEWTDLDGMQDVERIKDRATRVGEVHHVRREELRRAAGA